MDITQAIPAVAAHTAGTDKPNASPDSSKEAGESKIQGDAFSKLLQGAQSEVISAEQIALQDIAAQGLQSTESFDALCDVNALLGQASLASGAALSEGGAEVLPVLEPLLPAALAKGDLTESSDIDSLLAQTLHLDQRADNALRDGSHVWLSQSVVASGASALSALQGAQPHTAIGQTVATVAAGAQAPLEASKTFMAGGEAAHMATSVLADAVKVADTVARMADEVQGKEAPNEGRFSLQGNWKLDDPQTAPSAMLQRVMGQIEQWAVAGSGMQPKSNDRTESAKALLENAQSMVHGSNSGMRLTENAVREAQQAQNSSFESTQEAPVEDMRFWLQGKQQRAELQLDRDGQSVRVQVSVSGSEAHVTFLSEQQQTREMLDASLAQLRDMLAQQGVALMGVSVQAEAQSQQHAPQGDNAAPQQGDVKHAQIAVPAAQSNQSGQVRALDVYA